MIFLYAIVAPITLFFVGSIIALRFIDGPLGPIPGGVLKKGELISDHDPDWSTVLSEHAIRIVEFQLEESGTSRLVGVFLHEGQLYATCDLGFIGHRAPGALIGLAQTIILTFKNWHKRVLLDGRIVCRIEGKLYKRYASRVVDPKLVSIFRRVAIQEGTKFFGRLKAETDPPGDVWFFHLGHRKLQAAQTIG